MMKTVGFLVYTSGQSTLVDMDWCVPGAFDMWTFHNSHFLKVLLYFAHFWLIPIKTYKLCQLG